VTSCRNTKIITLHRRRMYLLLWSIIKKKFGATTSLSCRNDAPIWGHLSNGYHNFVSTTSHLTGCTMWLTLWCHVLFFSIAVQCYTCMIFQWCCIGEWQHHFCDITPLLHNVTPCVSKKVYTLGNMSQLLWSSEWKEPNGTCTRSTPILSHNK
jgi:hypothetical protein